MWWCALIPVVIYLIIPLAIKIYCYLHTVQREPRVVADDIPTGSNITITHTGAEEPYYHTVDVDAMIPTTTLINQTITELSYSALDSLIDI